MSSQVINGDTSGSGEAADITADLARVRRAQRLKQWETFAIASYSKIITSSSKTYVIPRKAETESDPPVDQDKCECVIELKQGNKRPLRFTLPLDSVMKDGNRRDLTEPLHIKICTTSYKTIDLTSCDGYTTLRYDGGQSDGVPAAAYANSAIIKDNSNNQPSTSSAVPPVSTGSSQSNFNSSLSMIKNQKKNRAGVLPGQSQGKSPMPPVNRNMNQQGRSNQYAPNQFTEYIPPQYQHPPPVPVRYAMSTGPINPGAMPFSPGN